MTTTTPIYDSAPVDITPAALQSLANNGYVQCAKRDNETDQAVKLRVFLTIKTTTTAAAAIGTVRILIAGAVDGGTLFAGNVSGTAGAYTPVDNNDTQLRLIDVFDVDATTTTARTLYMEAVCYDVPKDYVILIQNKTGAALLGSANKVEILVEQVSTT